jgi:hypothetical protein
MVFLLALWVTLGDDTSGSGAGSGTVPEGPATATEPAPAEPAANEGAATEEAAEEPVGLKLSPKPSPIKRLKPSAPTGDKWFANGDVTCAADLTVDAEGKPTALVAATSEEQCPKAFMKASLRAMKWWRFLPAQQDGKAIAATYHAEVTFTKDGEVVGADP